MCKHTLQRRLEELKAKVHQLTVDGTVLKESPGEITVSNQAISDVLLTITNLHLSVSSDNQPKWWEHL